MSSLVVQQKHVVKGNIQPTVPLFSLLPVASHLNSPGHWPLLLNMRKVFAWQKVKFWSPQPTYDSYAADYPLVCISLSVYLDGSGVICE